MPMPYTRCLRGSDKSSEGDAQLSSSLQYELMVCTVMEPTGADFELARRRCHALKTSLHSSCHRSSNDLIKLCGPRANQVGVYDVCRPMGRDLKRLLCQLLTAYIGTIRATDTCLSDRLGLSPCILVLQSAQKAA